MKKYVVEFRRSSKKDKRGEYAFVTIRFFDNGQRFLTSEKYENWRHALLEAKTIASELGAIYKEFIDMKLVTHVILSPDRTGNIIGRVVEKGKEVKGE